MAENINNVHDNGVRRRGNYIKKNTARDLKMQIKTVHANGGDWKGLTERLGVKKATAYRWVNEGEDFEEGQKGGRRRVIIHEEHKEFMTQCVEDNPLITLKQLTEEIRQRFRLTISKECVRQHLNGMLYTLKQNRFEPERANTEENKIRRANYIRQLINYQAENKPIIYLDETNFNLHVSRAQGRSLKGTRCSTIAAGSKGANIHLIGCISTLGLLHHEIRRGSFCLDNAQIFLRACLRLAMQRFGVPVVLVTDNAPCHSQLENVFLEPEFADNILLRLAPYSPALNPIEMAWSVMKAGVKRELATILPDVLAGGNNESQREFRLRSLETIIRRNIENINVQNCNAFIARIQSYIPTVLNHENLPF